VKVKINKSVQHSLSGAISLGIGVGGAKLITLAALPIITRLYQPADMGLLSLFSSAIMLFAPVLTFQYERALPLPKRSSVAINIFVLQLLIIVSMTFVLTVFLAFFNDVLFLKFSMKELSVFWWLLPLGAAFYALYRALQMWATRERRYSVMSNAELVQSAVGNLVKILIGLLSASSMGLLVGHIIALCGGGLRLLAYFFSSIRMLKHHVSLRRLRAVAIRYASYPIFRLPSQLILILATYWPIFFIGVAFGVAEAGQFGLAMMALTLPINLIARTMSNAYYGEIANLGLNANEKIRTSVFAVLGIYSVVGIVLSLLIYFIAPLLFPLVFGDEWVRAGKYAAILSIYLAFQFIAVPVMSVLSVFKQEKIDLLLNIQRLILVVGGFALSDYLGLALEQTLIMYSLIMVLHYCFSIYRVIRVIPKTSKK